ncbi:MAG: YraN family protein [Candidatus Paceibacterota bacterium]
MKHVSHETHKRMPKVFTSETQKIGKIGENIAERFLVKHNFSILDNNYTKKWGEIDIVAEKEKKLYFIEVKSVSRNLNYVSQDLSVLQNNQKGTETLDEYKPEDNMHPWKLKRMARTIQTYLLSNKVPDEKEWQVDLLVVFLDLKNKKAKIKVVNDIIL